MKERIIPHGEFITQYGQPIKGEEILTEYGKAEIIDVSSDGVTIQQKEIHDEMVLDYFRAQRVDEDEDSFTIERTFKPSTSTENGVAVVEEVDNNYVLTLDIENLEIGGIMYTEYGQGTIMEIAEDELVVDTNHALAGETLTFKITIVEIRKHMGQ
jgi:hypothetical protein